MRGGCHNRNPDELRAGNSDDFRDIGNNCAGNFGRGGTEIKAVSRGQVPLGTHLLPLSLGRLTLFERLFLWLYSISFKVLSGPSSQGTESLTQSCQRQTWRKLCCPLRCGISCLGKSHSCRCSHGTGHVCLHGVLFLGFSLPSRPRCFLWSLPYGARRFGRYRRRGRQRR